MAEKDCAAGPAPVWPPPPEDDTEIPKQKAEEEEVWLTAVSPDDYPNEDTCKTFIFREEGHTFGNALRYVISNYPEVKYCAYTLPHPAEKVMHLRIQTVPGVLPQDILARGLNDLHDLAKVILDKFTDEVEKCPEPKSVPEPELPIPKFGVADEEPASARARDTFTKTTEMCPTPTVSPVKLATFSSTLRSSSTPGQPTVVSKPGPSSKSQEQLEKESQAIRVEQIAHQDSVREDIRLKNLKKRKAQEEKAAEDLAAAMAKLESERLAKEKQDKEDAEILAMYKLDYPPSDKEESSGDEEGAEEPKPPPSVPSDPESEPELVNLADSD